MKTDNDIVFTVLLTTFTILLLVAGVVITVFISARQRMHQETKIARMQAEYEKELRTVSHEVQEQVMTNVAAELHDNIGQLLTAMHLQMEQKRITTPSLTEPLQPINETLIDTIQQVRLLSRNLGSDQLEQNGLLYAMKSEVNRLQHLNHFSLHWEHDEIEPALTSDQRLMSFRIFQELLNNAMKHSQAHNIYIRLTGKDRFVLQVQDDGIGFDVATVKAGSGLKNINRRAMLANLEITIDTGKGKDSIFTLQSMSA